MSESSGLSWLANADDLFERTLWGPLRQSFGLTPEQWKRLTEVVTFHMALDRLLFLRVTLGLTMVAGDRANVDRITQRVSKMQFAARLALAQDAGWISEDHTEDLAVVNRVRNKLLHYDVKRGVKEVPEIASAEAFRAFTHRGLVAWWRLTDSLMPLLQRAAEGQDSDPPAAPRS